MVLESQLQWQSVKMEPFKAQDQLRRDLVQSIENTRSALASLLGSTSKLFSLASKRSPRTSSTAVQNTGDDEELSRTFSEEVTRIQQLVDQFVKSFVQAHRIAEEYQHKVEQQDLEDSERCQQLSERVDQLSKQIWEKERKLYECKQRLRSFKHSLDLLNTWNME